MPLTTSARLTGNGENRDTDIEQEFRIARYDGRVPESEAGTRESLRCHVQARMEFRRNLSW